MQKWQNVQQTIKNASKTNTFKKQKKITFNMNKFDKKIWEQQKNTIFVM